MGKPITDENATFTWELNLYEKEIKNKLAEESEGITLMSCAFDACRRSFHLKLDICKASNQVSIWLVERGKSNLAVKDKEGLLSVEALYSLIPLKFSTVLAEIELVDTGANNRKTTFCFSFAHGAMQVAGHQNFI
jgi:hypothetical protein